MALVQGEFYSEALGMDTQITALIPEPSAACTAAAGGRNFPTLYILHGATGTHMDTVLQTELVQLVHIHFPNLAVVMPSGMRPGAHTAPPPCLSYAWQKGCRSPLSLPLPPRP